MGFKICGNDIHEGPPERLPVHGGGLNVYETELNVGENFFLLWQKFYGGCQLT